MEERNNQPTVNLPAPPSSWNTLTEKQLIAIHELMASGLTDTEYKLKALLTVLDLEVLKRAEKQDDGTFLYSFRRRGWRYRKERLAMQSWEVCYWIDKYLNFLDEPFRLTQLPFQYIEVGRKKFKAPDVRMMNLTYEQFGNAQRYLVAFWEASRMVDSLRKNGASIEALLNAESQALGFQAGFLAHMYVSGSWRIFELRSGMTCLKPSRVYAYHSEEAERNAEHFRAAPRWLFDVTYQFFQSSLAIYKRDFEYLFKEYDDENGKSALVMEIDTLNAVMKYAGYTDQQTVYESNVGFIFGFLNSMSHEAEEIEKMNHRIKSKKIK